MNSLPNSENLPVNGTRSTWGKITIPMRFSAAAALAGVGVLTSPGALLPGAIAEFN